MELLINGEATFASIFHGIANAEKFVLVQFYIIHDDGLGRELQQQLMHKAKQGLPVYLLYDEMGCIELPESYLEKLRSAGVKVSQFNTRKGPSNRFQVNFRNHRKNVVVDGRLAWIGGHNVGDEYLGKGKLGPWRDTHMKMEGPAALEAQLSFVQDWHWATGSLISLPWNPQQAETGNALVLVAPSGPADPLETASLMFLGAINSARHRVWIASPPAALYLFQRMVGHVVKPIVLVDFLRGRQDKTTLGCCIVGVNSIGSRCVLRPGWRAVLLVRLESIRPQGHQIADNQLRKMFTALLHGEQTHTATV